MEIKPPPPTTLERSAQNKSTGQNSEHQFGDRGVRTLPDARARAAQTLLSASVFIMTPEEHLNSVFLSLAMP